MAPKPQGASRELLSSFPCHGPGEEHGLLVGTALHHRLTAGWVGVLHSSAVGVCAGVCGVWRGMCTKGCRGEGHTRVCVCMQTVCVCGGVYPKLWVCGYVCACVCWCVCV